ncbi:hypothetical protein NQ839_00835 [Acinetobacter baumannii]|nr:hypothetical protein [Acinetobacter baumannii]
MNMFAKPELLCPSFPTMEVASDVAAKDQTVSFDLVSGAAAISCQVQAKVVRQVRVVGSILHPEDSEDQFYDQLVVNDHNYVQVISMYGVEAPTGLLFQLTPDQVAELNKQLEYYAIELADEELRGR